MIRQRFVAPAALGAVAAGTIVARVRKQRHEQEMRGLRRFIHRH